MQPRSHEESVVRDAVQEAHVADFRYVSVDPQEGLADVFARASMRGFTSQHLHSIETTRRDEELVPRRLLSRRLSNPRFTGPSREGAARIRARRARAAMAILSVATIALLTGSIVPLSKQETRPEGRESSVGYVRLANLWPDGPKVDVYLSKVADANFAQQVFRHVGYGLMSKYLALPVGTYAVGMRTEGAPESDPPVLTTQVTVQDGGAYTVAGVGKFSGLGLKVLTDDLSRPANGLAKVRVIQASVTAPVLDVELNDGTSVAKGVSFASTTNYQTVNPGTWTLRLKPSGSAAVTTLGAVLMGGGVYSLLVLDSANGLLLELRADARGGANAPDGGVEAGADGRSPAVLLTILASGLILIAGLVILTLRLARPNIGH